MTILPKKKSSKEKSESEPTDHSHSHSHGHSSTSEGRTRRSSPNRWLPQGASRNDRLVAHDPGGRYEEYNHHNHDVPSTSHAHKRRHRSSPHRSVRKHRHERAPVANNGNVGHSSPTHGHGRATNSPSPSQCEVSYDGYNSGDEYCKPHSMEADLSDDEASIDLTVLIKIVTRSRTTPKFWSATMFEAAARNFGPVHKFELPTVIADSVPWATRVFSLASVGHVTGHMVSHMVPMARCRPPYWKFFTVNNLATVF